MPNFHRQLGHYTAPPPTRTPDHTLVSSTSKPPSSSSSAAATFNGSPSFHHSPLPEVFGSPDLGSHSSQPAPTSHRNITQNFANSMTHALGIQPPTAEATRLAGDSSMAVQQVEQLHRGITSNGRGLSSMTAGEYHKNIPDDGRRHIPRSYTLIPTCQISR